MICVLRVRLKDDSNSMEDLISEGLWVCGIGMEERKRGFRFFEIIDDNNS